MAREPRRIPTMITPEIFRDAYPSTQEKHGVVAKVAYFHYQLRWMEDHGITLNAYWQKANEYFSTERGDWYDFVDWLHQNGFSGEIWSSYDEFCTNEYYDRELMFRLLDSWMYEWYIEDIKTHDQHPMPNSEFPDDNWSR